MLRTKVLLTGSLVLILAAFLLAAQARNSVWLSDVSLYESALRLSPKKSRAYNNLGRALVLHGKMDDAKRTLERALAQDPGNVAALNNLAVVHLDRDEYDKAIAYAFRALQTQPDNADAHNTLGEIYMKMHEFDTAFSHFRVSISLGPSNADRYYNAAMALDSLNRQREACAYLAESLARMDADADRGGVMAQMRRMDCP